MAYADLSLAATDAVDVIRPGYKQTEVGVIPEDWSASTVGAEFSIQLGKMLDSEKNQGVRKPFIGNRAVQWGQVDLSGIGSIKLTSADLQRYRLREGDLLVCEGGEVGRSAVWMAPVDECYYQKALHRLRSKRGYDVTVMLNVLFMHASSGLLQNYVTQTSIAHLPKDKFELVPIPLPSKAEQEVIAEALSDADALIESLQHLIAKKRQIKQGAMQTLLTGQQRLPGYTGAWVEVMFGDLGKCHRGVSYNPDADLTAFDTKSSVRLLRSNNVQDARIVFADVQYVNSSRVSSDQQLRDGDIMICMANGSRELVGKAGSFASRDGFSYTFGAFMGAFRPHQDAGSKEFVFYLFQTEAYRNHISILLAGSSINNLTPTSIEALAIEVPTSEGEKIAIASVLTDMDTEIAALEARLNKTREIKQGMMQALLTGAIRLPLAGVA